MNNTKVEVVPISCGGCIHKWTGVNRAHCSACHITFGGPSKFDQHRRRNKCMPLKLIEAPIDAGGLGLSDNGKGVWTAIYNGGENAEDSDLSDE
jgi:hypothetical protein